MTSIKNVNTSGITVLQLASTVLWARILLPSSATGIPAARNHTDDKHNLVLFAFNVTIATLSFIAFLIAGTIPQAPPYHFHSLYTYTVESDLMHRDIPNVSKDIEASVLGILMFNWVTPVIKCGSSKLQMGLDDLPHLSASFRTVTLYKNFRKAARKSVERAMSSSKTPMIANDVEGPRDGLGYAPKWFNRLLWRLLVVNRFAFSLNCLLAFATAGLYYLPAFFLSRLLDFFETSHQSQNREKTLGYAHCLGMLLSLVLDAIATGQLWYISNCMVRRLRYT